MIAQAVAADVCRALKVFCSRYGRVIGAPGKHELWTTSSGVARRQWNPDSGIDAYVRQIPPAPNHGYAWQ